MDAEIKKPSRYFKNGIEVWDIERAFIGQRGFEDHLQAAAVEYILRFREKNVVEDLEKAIVVIERLISELKRGDDGYKTVSPSDYALPA